MTTAPAHILVIDDDPLVRLIASQMLSQAGYRVSVAEDGDEGVRQIETRPFDLVITDLIMPNKEGVETIREIKQRWPQVPMIAISSGGQLDAGYYLPLAKAMGATAVMQKPLRKETFLPLIEEVLAARPSAGFSRFA
ncbi:response regulator [Brevundimonas sp.]|uniref:response regulator n=1 Tax=Brevundimonas sp. TaxID=1871086 RepID=UPI0025E5821E|nr:response regulator [Brevundimonas sp.]